jgi:hypothetical protein
MAPDRRAIQNHVWNTTQIQDANERVSRQFIYNNDEAHERETSMKKHPPVATVTANVGQAPTIRPPAPIILYDG